MKAPATKSATMNSVKMALLFTLLLVSWCFAATVKAQGNQSDSKKTVKKEDKKSSGGMTHAREAAALAFVEEHHPQLKQLLIHLEANQPKQYQAALRDLYRTSDKLGNFFERDRPRYELELQSWKLKSRGQLLAAQLLMSPEDDELLSQLTKVLRQQHDVGRQLLVLERERARERIKRLDAQIERIDEGADKMVQRQIRALLDGPAAKGKTNKVKSTPATPNARPGT